MKKKGPRDIPDFSRKLPQKGSTGVRMPADGAAPKPPRVSVVKPSSTMPKGGRRGG
ncbi:MAG: hypothetical protein ABIT38_06940 [Gemmatimonadaceae bacterium]